MKSAPLVILGTGMAGYTLARMWRMKDKERPLVLITRDGGEAYAKPMLSKALSDGKTPEELVNATAGQQARSLKAEILTRTEVEEIRPQSHQLKLADGRLLPYGQLVLASGARPIRIPLAGDAADTVMQVNWLDDYRSWRQRLQGKKRVLIIGPGLIGLEFASDLCKAGYQPVVVGPDETPLGQLLPPEVGRFVRARLEEAGIVLHLNTVVERLDHHGDALRAQLGNGTVLEVDVVLMAVGLQPDIRLAQAAGLAVDRGVVVDDYLQTSEPDIYALGDVAQYPQGWMPYVAPITAGARALAATLNGEATPMRLGPTPIQVKTGVFPLWLMPPKPGTPGAWTLAGDTQRLEARFEGEQGLQGWVLGGEAVALRNAWAGELRTRTTGV